MFYSNPECSQTIFAERFSFLSEKSKKTDRLKEEIMHMSINCSLVATEFLSKNVASIGKFTICSYVKNSVPTFYKSNVVQVCIDDFALKKRKSYGTIMVDLMSHRIIDMIESREYTQVKQ